jgi:hypothetical protein
VRKAGPVPLSLTHTGVSVLCLPLTVPPQAACLVSVFSMSHRRRPPSQSPIYAKLPDGATRTERARRARGRRAHPVGLSIVTKGEARPSRPCSGVSTFRRNPGRPQCRSGFQPDWSGGKPDLHNREPLFGGDRGGGLCAGVSRRIHGRLLLRRSPVGNRTCAVGAFCLLQNCRNSRARLSRPCSRAGRPGLTPLCKQFRRD